MAEDTYLGATDKIRLLEISARVEAGAFVGNAGGGRINMTRRYETIGRGWESDGAINETPGC